MKQHLQNTLIKNLYESGCYFLCICEIAERHTGRPVDIIKTAVKALEEGWIEEDFTILRPAQILEYLTEKSWVCIKSEKESKEPDSYTVQCYKNNRTGYTHFRMEDWDSLKDSVTVREGKIISYRIFLLNR